MLESTLVAAVAFAGLFIACVAIFKIDSLEWRKVNRTDFDIVTGQHFGADRTEQIREQVRRQALGDAAAHVLHFCRTHQLLQERLPGGKYTAHVQLADEIEHDHLRSDPGPQP